MDLVPGFVLGFSHLLRLDPLQAAVTRPVVLEQTFLCQHFDPPVPHFVSKE